jgi:iron complex transport system permease protein
VIAYLRLARTLLAALVGCALAVSGAIYQSAFNNKLVSPDLLGV